MNSTTGLIARSPAVWLRPRRENRGFDQSARIAVETRWVQTVHGSNCICHRCSRG